MYSILFALYAVIAIASAKHYKEVCNPLTFFCSVWSISLLLLTFNIVEYYPASDTILVVLTLQILGFSIGCCVSEKYSVKLSWGKRVITSSARYELRLWIIIIFSAITIANLSSETITQIVSLIKGKSFYQIANENLIMENQSTGIIVLLKIFIVFPTVYAISPITAVNMLSEKRSKWLLPINIIIVALYSLQHGARVVILYTVLCYVLVFMFSNRIQTLKKKQKIFIFSFVIFAIYVFFWLTASRGVEDVGTHIYKYLTINVPLEDHWIKEIKENNSFTYGFMSFKGFIEPVFILLRGTGVVKSYPRLLELANTTHLAIEDVAPIGPNQSSNAFVGFSFPFYADAGLFGVLIGSLLCGYICFAVYKHSRATQDPKKTAMAIMFMSCLAMSFCKFFFSGYNFAMALVMFLIFYKKETQNK